MNASRPIFIPFPLIGTFGAFIRIRSPIYSKRDCSTSGWPGRSRASFLLPALAIGLAFSKSHSRDANERGDQFGVPSSQACSRKPIFPGVRRRGHLSTSGGSRGLDRHAGHGPESAPDRATGRRPHPVLVLSERRHKLISTVFLRCCCTARISDGMAGYCGRCCCFSWRRGIRRSTIPPTSAGAARWLGWLALVIFLLCFTCAPIGTGGL